MIGTKYDVEVIAAGGARVHTLPQGTVLYDRGDRGDVAWIVKSGAVEIRERGRAVEILEPGEIFGETALIDDEPRTATAVAVGEVELIPIDRRMFDVLLRDDSDFALTIVRLVSRRLRAAMNLLDGRDEEPPASRVGRA